jgi:hypothetical protein
MINGLRHDWSSVEPKINGQILQGIKSINYTSARDAGYVRGISPDPIGQTRGTNTFTADCEVYLAEWNLLLNQLGDGWGDSFFNIQVSYAEIGFDQITDLLIGCRLIGVDASQSQSADPLSRKLTFLPTKIYYQGFDDLATPLTAPPTNFLNLG